MVHASLHSDREVSTRSYRLLPFLFCSSTLTLYCRAIDIDADLPSLPDLPYLPDTTQVLKPIPGAERRIEVKFNDDADDSGRTPGRPLPARYVVPLPEGFEEDDSKPAEMTDDEAPPPATAPAPAAGGGNGGGASGAGEDDADDPMGEYGVPCGAWHVGIRAGGCCHGYVY